MHQVYHVKLVTGEELLGELLGTTEETNEVILKTPMSMSDVPQNGTNGLVLTRFSSFNQVEVITLKPEHIISYSPVIDEMAEYYNLSVEYTNKVSRKAVMIELNEINRTLRTLLRSLDSTDLLQRIDTVDFDSAALFSASSYSSNTHH